MVVQAVASTTPVRAVSDSVSQKIGPIEQPQPLQHEIDDAVAAVQHPAPDIAADDGGEDPGQHQQGPHGTGPREGAVEEDGKGKAEDERQRQRPTGVEERDDEGALQRRIGQGLAVVIETNERRRAGQEVADLDIVKTEVDGIEDRVEDGGQDEDGRGQHEKVFAEARIAERTAVNRRF